MTKRYIPPVGSADRSEEADDCTLSRPAPRSSFTPPAQTIPISGVWLRHIGENMEVLVEVAGDWYLCISEHIGPNETGITYIANAQGIRDWPKEPTHV